MTDAINGTVNILYVETPLTPRPHQIALGDNRNTFG